ncbi:MAG: PQQ-binding-like beta-propeller repeat protein [Planctomycetes bacterium]|nr:PQQ-binding-like beta-propeller repeat protein [Planctomycetota bacterium]
MPSPFDPRTYSPAFALALAALAACAFCSTARAGEPATDPAPAPAAEAKVAPIENPFPDPYGGKDPCFVQQLRSAGGYGGAFQNWIPGEDQMKLSSEPTFYTLNLVEEMDRAYALIEAAMKKESEGQWREALKIYQDLYEKLLIKNPDILYRISKYGIFVPATQFVQRRILRFPKEHLAFYRTMYDARAKEAFEQARRQYSLIGLSDIVDNMLATSYGDNALMELGNAALDTGHYLEAMEYFTTIRDFFPDSECLTPELDIRIQYCQKMLGMPEGKAAAGGRRESALKPEEMGRLKQVLAGARYVKPKYFTQPTSPPYDSSDDYTLYPPSKDPIALEDPTWQFTLPGSRNDWFVFSEPCITKISMIYRHKNILYCRSLLNGELRWTNDLGGRVVWQNTNERQFPREDVLVQDGLVFAPMYKVGASIVALDEVTGQLKWAYGPMVASTPEEANMRFETAPAGGPRTVYAGYVQDNIEGETHTDSHYGIVAFDSSTGRIRWQKILCRLTPGKFSGGFAENRRNRIRSFISPPLYHQGTVYYNTNAGVIAAMDARSGRIKWLMKYPYFPGIHDATREFGSTSRPYYDGVCPYRPFLWFNQRPMMIGENLYLPVVDSRFFFCIDRQTGRVVWSTIKSVNNWDEKAKAPNLHKNEDGGMAYFLGPNIDGNLVFAYRSRDDSIQTVDPKTGATIWKSEDLLLHDNQPVVDLGPHIYGQAGIGTNRRWFESAARPFLTVDNQVVATSYALINTGGYGLTFAYGFNLAHLDLNEKKVLRKRRYYTGELMAVAEGYITNLVPAALKANKELPHKDEKMQQIIKEQELIVKDTVPVNEFGPFRPFTRMTFNRYGIDFELRFGTREVGMLYDRAAARRVLAERKDPESIFARAELAIADSRLDEAADLLNQCLGAISSEDLDFRAAINQQLYGVHKRLARSGIRAGDSAKELTNGLGMSRTSNTLAEEMETLFALAEGYERKGELNSASRCLRSVINTYGHHEYPIASVLNANPEQIRKTAIEVMDRAEAYAKDTLYGQEFLRSLALLKKGLPLYFSTVSPLPKTLTVRAGELAAARLAKLQAVKPDFRKSFEAIAAQSLNNAPAAEQLHRLWEFPATETAQSILSSLFETTGKGAGFAEQQKLWQLADAARICGLKVPPAFAARVGAPPPPAAPVALALPATTKEYELEASEGTSWLVMQRKGEDANNPDLFFVAGRVKKRLDNKFIVQCRSFKTGEIAWETQDIRLRGTGQEAGFFDAYVYGDSVVVHGLYDVVSFNLKDGKERWHYRVPFDFEIKKSVMSGDLLILAGKAETMALYLASQNPDGDIAWQVEEQGDLYADPFTLEDRVVFLRKLPFNVTVRYRGTGKLIGRLALPDLSLHPAHPLVENGTEALPAAREGDLLIVTDSWYYIAIDVRTLTVVWKRLIDENDVTREPAMRMAVGGDFLSVTKENYDQKVIYMLNSKTGQVLWNTDPKNANSAQPMYDVYIHEGKAYGIGVHPGQGFYFLCYNGADGKRLFRTEVKDYQAKPKVELLPKVFGKYMVAQVQDGQDFQLRVFDIEKGALVHTVALKGAGSFGIHGRVSGLVHNGRLVLLSKDKMNY